MKWRELCSSYQAKGKGTSIDVRVPILRGEDNVE